MECSKCGGTKFKRVKYVAPWATVSRQQRRELGEYAVDVTCVKCGHIEEELLENE